MKQVTCPTCYGKGFAMARSPREAAILDILFTVAHNWGVSLEDIRGASKIKHIVAARHEAMRELRAAGLMLKEVGRWTGGRDHSTVIHALKKVV